VAALPRGRKKLKVFVTLPIDVTAETEIASPRGAVAGFATDPARDLAALKRLLEDERMGSAS
jgi:hypothetical protein